MTVKAKAIVTAFYSGAPRLSYWQGCSSGGKQGLKEAQRFPDDYDGIVAGAPANYWTHLSAHAIWVAQATLKDPASFIPPAQYALINKAAVDACDALDGVKDGVIENPAQCRFDPKVLQCADQDGPTCLTRAQVAAVSRIYGPATNPRTGAVIFPGLAPGSELGWGQLAGGPKPLSISDDHFKYVVFADPDWDFRTFDFDRDLAKADQIDGGRINAMDPDLQRLRRARRQAAHVSRLERPAHRAAEQHRLLRQRDADAGRGERGEVRPPVHGAGMRHCGGGIGPNTSTCCPRSSSGSKKAQRPRSSASHATAGTVDRTRPLCPYPQVAQYKRNRQHR